MHILLLVLIVLLVWAIRFFLRPRQAHEALFPFLFPPLVIFFTLLSIIAMGRSGEMFGLPSGFIAYLLSLSLLLIIFLVSVQKFWQMNEDLKKIRQLPLEEISNSQVRMIDIEFPYIAQIGFWSPELVMSKGFVYLLEPEELTAVLAHEKAHYIFRDTFCFFVLDLIRSLTFWLPNTQMLWQKLILMREIRADRWALRVADPLVLTQSLLKIIGAVSQKSKKIEFSDSFSALFHPDMSNSHLLIRIDSILEKDEAYPSLLSTLFLGVLSSLLPLLLVIWHSA